MRQNQEIESTWKALHLEPLQHVFPFFYLSIFLSFFAAYFYFFLFSLNLDKRSQKRCQLKSLIGLEKICANICIGGRTPLLQSVENTLHMSNSAESPVLLAKIAIYYSSSFICCFVVRSAKVSYLQLYVVDVAYKQSRQCPKTWPIAEVAANFSCAENLPKIQNCVFVRKPVTV